MGVLRKTLLSLGGTPVPNTRWHPDVDKKNRPWYRLAVWSGGLWKVSRFIEDTTTWTDLINGQQLFSPERSRMVRRMFCFPSQFNDYRADFYSLATSLGGQRKAKMCFLYHVLYTWVNRLYEQLVSFWKVFPQRAALITLWTHDLPTIGPSFRLVELERIFFFWNSQFIILDVYGVHLSWRVWLITERW